MAFGRPPHFTPEQDIELERRYAKGESTVTLAAEAGVSRKAVENALHRRGVVMRNKREGQIAAANRRKAQGLRHPNYRGEPVRYAGKYLAVSITEDDPMFSMAIDRGRLKDYVHSGYVLEHRLVMARHLGRALTARETVHHRNGDTRDNRIENLELWVGNHGRGASAPHCSTCTCFAHD